jgi:PAS domain S-box-containing protein
VKPSADLAAPAELGANSVLDQVETGVLVIDKQGNLRYANAYAVTLFGFPDDAAGVVGRSLVSLGFEDGDARKSKNLMDQVLRGRSWDGTFASRRADGSWVFVRAQGAPLRESSGEISGVVIMAHEATGRGTQHAVDRIGLLDRIGERLAGSLELSVTLRQVAETLVPQFADHCFIDLLQGAKLVRRAQLHARGWTPEPGTWAIVGEQIRYPPGHFCQLAMSRLETVVVADLGEEFVPAPSAQSLKASDAVGLSSVMASPLVARGELLGVMSLALSGLTKRDDQRYSAADLDFLGAIASRVAVAIDNSMLFEEERRTALAFQTSLLPHGLPLLDGLEVAYSYVPAKPLETHGQGIQTQVGGDWYDIIPLSAGRVGLVIGDVEGRGARAAATMGQLRAALRAFAQDDKPPAEILRRLDDWCRALGPSQAEAYGLAAADPPTVSCTYLVYDAWSRMLSFANAGHAPPMLVTEAGVGELDISYQGVLLGARGRGMTGLPSYREESRELPPGSTLVFYTDGLTDRRHRVDGPGHYSDAEVQRMLRQAVEAVGDGSVEEVALAVEHAVPGEIDDDMAIVVVRTSQEDLASWEARFPAEPIQVSQTRKLAMDTFRAWGLGPEQADLACLLVSEVVTNVVLHAANSPSPPGDFELEPDPLGWLPIDGDWGGLSPDGPSPDGPPPDGLPPDGPPRGAPADKADKEFTLRLRRGHESVWVEVLDADLRLPRIRTAAETDEGGRGLYLVDQLATRWGARPTEDGKVVWFEVPIKSSRAG